MISVIIATYNRMCLLSDLLKDLIHQEDAVLGKDFEIIIVDNNSTDNTKTIVDRYIEEYGKAIKYMFQSKQGKPYALNIAIPEAKGDWILFLDDDVRIDKRFIRVALEIMDEAKRTQVVLIGGRIDPLLETKKPDWLSDEYSGFLGINKITSDIWLLTQEEIKKNKPWNSIFGANMMVKKEVFEVVGLYSEVHRYAQDTEIAKRICDAGYKILLTSRLRVSHYISLDKLTKDHLRMWAYRRGFISARSTEYLRKWYHLFGIPWEIIGKYFIYGLLSLLCIKDALKLKMQIKASWYKGSIDGYRLKYLSM